MERGRRMSWIGRPGPQHVSVRGLFRTSRVSLNVLPESLSASSIPNSSKIPPSTEIKTHELNRQTREFRDAVTHRKERSATCSNRQKIRFCETNNPQTSALTRSAFRERFLTLLTGSGSQTEFAVTHSKQKTEKILTGARTHIRIFEILQKSAQNDDATSIVIPNEAVSAGPPKSTASRAWGRGHEVAGIGPFLTETAQHSEFAVTHSKQTTGEFLTETRIASLAHRNSSNIDSKLLEGRAWLRQ
jgi:hypothetical protein